MGASAMNAKKKGKRRRHAKSRKTSSEALAAATQNRPEPRRVPSAGSSNR